MAPNRSLPEAQQQEQLINSVTAYLASGAKEALRAEPQSIRGYEGQYLLRDYMGLQEAIRGYNGL